MYYDWEAALKHLNDVKEKYMELPEGLANLNILLKCNPYIERYQNGERTKDLYDSIMELK
jgi:hypothetical protein